MQKFQFFNLPRPIQERFIESTRGYAAPKPLLYRAPARNLSALALAAVASALFLLCATTAWIGFGDLNHRWALNPRWLIVVYGASLALACVSVVGAFRHWTRESNVPFRRGIYVFPVGVIDAQGAVLQLHSVQELEEFSIDDQRVRMSFSDGTAIDFGKLEPQLSDKIKNALFDAQQQLSIPAGDRSRRDRALLDPLSDTGYKNPFSPHESMRPAPLSRTGHWLLVAACVGVALGFGLWRWRNWLSAQYLYNRARGLDTSAAYQAYLARGGRKSDIREIWLPRAELRDAQAKGSVEAIERYLEGHPQSKIAADIETVLRESLRRELERARDLGSLSALRELRKDDPHLSLIRPEIDAAEQALRRSALAHFQSVSRNSPELIAFFTKLTGYTLQHGPKVEIRFRRRIPASFERADAQVRMSPYCDNSTVPPAQYFDDEHVAKREARVAAAIRERFASVFPNDIINFELAPPLPDDGAQVPIITSPTLLITHRTELSSPFTSRKPKGVFVGVGLVFKALLMIPGESSTHAFESSTWAPPNLKKLESEKLGPAELYEAMAEEAFGQFLKRFMSSMFPISK